MKKIYIVISAFFVVVLAGIYLAGIRTRQRETTQPTMSTEQDNEVYITPISHATMVLGWGDYTIYTDPVEDNNLFPGQESPDVILLTDIHPDHLNIDTLKTIAQPETTLIVPQAVVDQLPKEGLAGNIVVLHNGEQTTQGPFMIEAVPMYNVPESDSAFHTKGRGNGYVVEGFGKRVYISGDTGNIPELRALQNIDIAFVCMNLPYTMSVEDAAQAVLTFKPKQVIPYHYRGQDGLSDIYKFKQLVNAGDPNITVELLNFYPPSKSI